MIDIRKAMRLLDTMYVTANEGIKQSVDKIVTLARLDDPLPFGAEAGPFETMLNEFEPIKWNWTQVKASADKFERFLSSPHNEWQFTNWLTGYITSLPLLSSMENRIKTLEQQLQETQAKVAILTTTVSILTNNQDKDESKPNSNTE